MSVIIDYQMGNLRSVLKACQIKDPKTIISDDAEKILNAKRLILPGVGAFSDAVKELKKKRLFQIIKEKIAQKTPFLGICLGMQLCFESSQEAPKSRGLGVLKGRVVRFKGSIKVPQIGWNNIKIKKQACPLFKGLTDNEFVYFCHSFYCDLKDKSQVAAVTNYGRDYCSIAWHDNIYAVQFHPEKSQRTGLKILHNFLKIKR